MTLFEPGKPLTFGDFTVTVLKSKHSPGSVGGDSTPITAPLSQPAGILAYYEGGSFDFLFEHGGRRALFKNSANFIPGALDDVRAETLFLGVATLSKQGQDFRTPSMIRRWARFSRNSSSRQIGTTSFCH